MNVTQVWAFTPTGEKIKLDTYPTDPIRLTFSIESVLDLAQVSSNYSQAFRLPATRINDQFFRHWFNVNATDFDISQKVIAELITSTGFFIRGHIRLQKVYRNLESTSIDYEIVFLGEVRDFATQVGDGFMNSININALSHILDWDNITASWTGNLFSGDIRYPLVEYGYDFDQNGVCLQPQITTAATNARRFTQQANALLIQQWRPWVRAKALIDAMFAETTYTYKSDFLNSDLFKDLYVNASGNIDTALMDDLIFGGTIQVANAGGTEFPQPFTWTRFKYPIVIQDSGGNWSTTTNQYTAPIAGQYTFTGPFTGIVTSGFGAVVLFVFEISRVLNGVRTLLYSEDNEPFNPMDPPFPAIQYNYTLNETLTLNPGDQVSYEFRVYLANSPGFDANFQVNIFPHTLSVPFAPTSVNPSILLNDKVKKIDWFKSILTKFKLVMVPNRQVPSEFIIEPWVDWIGSGKNLDWSDKLDGSLDMQLEPLFFDQSDTIIFTDDEDSDYPNRDNLGVYKEVYGTRIYRADNELLDGQRTISTKISPTPVERVKGLQSGSFIIPSMASLEPIDEQSTGGLLKPIVARPRLLFWNGMASTDSTGYWVQTSPSTTQQLFTYPRMSYLSEFPPQADTLNLSWEIEPPRWIGAPETDLGFDVYTKYWEEFIESTYSPRARKLTAHFILDSIDLQVDFNDNIFIRDSWWRPVKIHSAPLEGINRVKVELIKLLEAPNQACQCLGYFVSDLRFEPVSPWGFSYIDCETGNQVNTDVFAETKLICSCEPIFTGNKQVQVTPTGAGCPVPTPLPTQ